MVRLIIIFLLTAVLIGGIVFVFNKNFKENFSFKTEESKKTSFYTFKFEPLKVSSELQSYPNYTENKKLVLIPLAKIKQDAIQTDIELGGCKNCGSQYQGSNSPEAAPDFKSIAFIDKNNLLGFITSDGKTKTLLPENFKVEYISGWSPDSRRLVVYVSSNTSDSLYSGMGGPPDKPYIFDQEKLLGGFYLIDIEKGEGKHLFPLKGFVTWVDSRTILATNNEPLYTQFFIFDVDKFEADAKTLLGLFDNYFGKDFSFSADGKKWVVGLGNTGDSGKQSYSEIVIANYPETKGIKIAQGTWAEYQLPIISPNGNRVIYINHTGSSDWNLVIWKDGQSKMISGKIHKKLWVGNDQVLYETGEYDEQKKRNKFKTYLYDVASEKSELLYETSPDNN
ncbi:hypothetical protein HYS93_04000 [Candidatus Daviesbacteria bacterium]|nr:hypothetical protein [Candidatus Daviesbacteria bacterium]